MLCFLNCGPFQPRPFNDELLIKWKIEKQVLSPSHWTVPLLWAKPNLCLHSGQKQKQPEKTFRIKNISFWGKSTFSTWKRITSLGAKALMGSSLSSKGYVYRRDVLSFDCRTEVVWAAKISPPNPPWFTYLMEASWKASVTSLPWKILIAAVIAWIKQMNIEDNRLWVKIITW